MPPAFQTAGGMKSDRQHLSKRRLTEAMDSLKVTIIAAVSKNGVLASGGKIPWHLPRDIAHFRARTAGHWLLLGRTTYEQMTGWFQPGQVPVVLTGRADYPVENGWAVGSVAEALTLAGGQGVEELVVCGGGQVYAAALPWAEEIIQTIVELEVEGETRFPELPEGGWKLAEEERFPAEGPEVPAMSIRTWVRWRDDE